MPVFFLCLGGSAGTVDRHEQVKKSLPGREGKEKREVPGVLTRPLSFLFL